MSETNTGTTQEGFRPPYGQSADIPSPDLYLQSLSELSKNHVTVFGDISYNYESDATRINASTNQGSADFVSKMQTVKDQVQSIAGSTFLEFESIVNKAPLVYRQALDDPAWAKVQYAVKEYGVGSTYVIRAINNGSSSQVREAMKAALDKDVWAKVQYAVKEYGVGSTYVDRAVGLGSSTATRARIAEMKTMRFSKENQEQRQEYRIRDEDVFYSAGSRRSGGQNNTRDSSKGKQAPPMPPKVERVAPDPRIAVLRGKTTGGSDKPYTTVLANIDAHRAKGKTDKEIYYLLMRHFHPDKQHPDGHAVSAVLSTVYDPKEKTFIV